MLIFIASIAETTRVDLDAAVEAKITKNAVRRYRRLDNGVLVKTEQTIASE